jgi:hypothetical protein
VNCLYVVLFNDESYVHVLISYSVLVNVFRFEEIGYALCALG